MVGSTQDSHLSEYHISPAQHFNCIPLGLMGGLEASHLLDVIHENARGLEIFMIPRWLHLLSNKLILPSYQPYITRKGF